VSDFLENLRQHIWIELVGHGAMKAGDDRRIGRMADPGQCQGAVKITANAVSRGQIHMMLCPLQKLACGSHGSDCMGTRRTDSDPEQIEDTDIGEDTRAAGHLSLPSDARTGSAQVKSQDDAQRSVAAPVPLQERVLPLLER